VDVVERLAGQVRLALEVSDAKTLQALKRLGRQLGS
jgi:hypothetical protein